MGGYNARDQDGREFRPSHCNKLVLWLFCAWGSLVGWPEPEPEPDPEPAPEPEPELIIDRISGQPGAKDKLLQICPPELQGLPPRRSVPGQMSAELGNRE